MALSYTFKNKLLILRLHRLQHIPSAKDGAQLLKEAGLPIVIYEYGMEFSTDSVLQEGLPTLRLGVGWAKWLPQFLRAGLVFITSLFFLIQKTAFDRPRFIYTHGIQEQWLAFFINLFFKIPYACHVHEIYELKELRRLIRLFFKGEGYTLRRADFTVFSSEERAEIYRQSYGLIKPTHIAYNTPRSREPGLSTTFYERHGIPPQKKVLLYIGGIAPLNASEEIIESAPYLSEDLMIVFAGWGEEQFVQQLKDRVLELGLRDQVKFVGPVTNKWDWIDNANAGLCIYNGADLRAQFNAGPSCKLFEFISAGKPVITNQAEDFMRIVDRNRLGITVDPKRPMEMAEKINGLLQDDLEMKRIQSNARNLHLNLYNYEEQYRAVAQQLAKIA